MSENNQNAVLYIIANAFSDMKRDRSELGIVCKITRLRGRASKEGITWPVVFVPYNGPPLFRFTSQISSFGQRFNPVRRMGKNQWVALFFQGDDRNLTVQWSYHLWWDGMSSFVQPHWLLGMEL